MIVIDWWSPEPHAQFNRNFYPLLIGVSEIYVFNSALSTSCGKSIVKKGSKNRILRALSVLKICWNHRHSKIMFTSYDDIFLPLTQLFVKSIFCYEHNTTPEFPTRNKHAIWQKLTFYRIWRLCQSVSQLNILREMGQRAVWLGLPISKAVNLTINAVEPVFMFCSEQFSGREAESLIPLLYGKIIAKKSLGLIGEIRIPEHLQIDFVDRITIPADFLTTEAMVIALDSSVRGTGWYNEAIAFGIPIIITSVGQQNVFETTYPGYPFIRGNTLTSMDDLKTRIANIKSFDHANYVKDYMKDIRLRLESIINYKVD